MGTSLYSNDSEMASNKKRKAGTGTANAGVVSVKELRQQTEDIVSKLRGALDGLEDAGPGKAKPLIADASVNFLQLKSLQHRLLNQIHESQEILQKQREERDKQELQLESLKYQKIMNRHAMEKAQNPDISNLVQLSRSEVAEGSDEQKVDDKAALQKFLQADVMDPVQRAVILDKLNQQLRTRKRLKAELEKVQKEASSLKQSLTSQRKLLDSLPSKLIDMERASQPLQIFCQKSLNASKATSSNRLATIELAQSLPKALYSLYYLLQSALHHMEASGEMDQLEEKNMVPDLGVQKDASRVILKIPIPPVSDRAPGPTSTTLGFGGSKKIVSIAFEYKRDSNFVFAACSEDHDMGGLLAEIFPRDTGEGMLGESGTSASDDSYEAPSGNGRPYNWCNYLAGLHVPPSGKSSQAEMHKSASVVINLLIQRVRAHATLTWILHALSRKPHPLPVHPSMKVSTFAQEKDSPVKLVSWTEDSQTTGESSSIDYYLATLKRRGSSLKLRVGISTARYPVQPPIWEMNPVDGGGSSGSLDNNEAKLYDETLSNLERSINQNLDHLALHDDETTYEWILVHQLAEIATKWEEQLQRND